MTSKSNKLIDRTPFILAAGKRSDNTGDCVASCLKNYSIDDASAALKLVAKISDEKPKYKAESYKNSMRKGIYTEIQPILQPRPRTRYQTLINELKETTYDSHWNKIVGKGRNQIPGLPAGLNPLEVTFGAQSNKNESVKDLVNPPKGVYQVLTESQICHEMYKKSHNNYNIGEKVCRNYVEPAFDKSKRFGEHSKYDPRGIWVRCACTWHQNEPAVLTSKTQADFLNKTRNKLGECLRPYGIASKLPQDFVCGRPYRKDLYSVQELLRDSSCPPCQFKRELKCWLASLNKLRVWVKKKPCVEFTLDDLCKRFLYYDVEKCGTLPLDVFDKICACYKFMYDRENLEPLLRLLSIICEDRINYSKFLDIVNFQKEPVELMKINDIPESNQYYVTSYQSAVCDYLIINNSDSPMAGIPSIRSDFSRPVVPAGGCRADLENLGNDSSAGILLNPSIYFNYGLSFRDFFIPRKPNVIRSLFQKSGHNIDDAAFEKLWAEAVEHDKTGLVCVDTFNNLLQKHYAESTSQYDAIRAYLKELDITENIWIGLSKATERPEFTWTNFHPLNGDGHWQQPVPKGNEAICVSMDPVADFLWKPMTCGGPEIASFICELPVPSWAIGPKGCLLTELPSLTVLYIPEQLALELTSDCGLDGTKRIACKGNADREEILKQLTCAMLPDDFEEKSTKSPILLNTVSSSAVDISSESATYGSKTTKPWIWTSNTIDIDYGMPTRHRRETEDTLSPSSTKSTTDFTSSGSHKENKLTTASPSSVDTMKTVSISPEDVMLDLSVSQSPEKPAELKTTQSTDSITQNSNIPEEQGEVSENSFATIESKVMESELQDNGEYPSAIGQGQLFSIIENGTMFDIIEVNETSDDSEQTKDVMMETPQSEAEILGASTDHSNENLYTTVVYQKEPPSELNFVTNKSIKKSDKQSKKHLFKYKDGKRISQEVVDKPTTTKSTPNKKEIDTTEKLSKEAEMFPIMTDPMAKLNRTHRKEVPFSEDREIDNVATTLDGPLNSSTTKINTKKHQHVEIKWQDKQKNQMEMKLFVTTKRVDQEPAPPSNQTVQQVNLTNDQTTKKIDTKIDLLSNNSINSNDSEIYGMVKPEEIKTTSEESSLKEDFLPKSLLEESTTKPDSTMGSLSNEPLEPEPQIQPRPNRQRQLTRPQRRSFYPYFFSRVLG